MKLLIALLTIAAVVTNYFGAKDTHRKPWYARARKLSPLLTILAVIGTYADGHFATRAKQAEVEEQQRQLDSIAKNIEELVAQGRLSEKDAKRVFVRDHRFKDDLGGKVKPTPRSP
jgi:hypothetical protein